MPPNRRPLAKLSPPRPVNVVRRGRLFDRLDQLCGHPVAWIAGEPGAGKTTLAASYLRERRRRGIWYQVDRGDNDLATFFHYLGLAAMNLPRAARRGPLPRPSGHRYDPAAFSRRFFRDLFDRLPKSGVLVFDNFHHVAENERFAAMLSEAFDQIPEGINVFVVSRQRPPSSLIGQLAQRRVASLDARELRFTSDEARRLASADKETDEATVERMVRRSEGWAAGLVLMLDRSAIEPGAGGGAYPAEQATFDYLAAEIFGTLPPETRRLLLAVALLPRFTEEMACVISGDDDAGKELAELHRRNFLINRLDAPEATYELHGLFRAFLQEQARRTLPPEQYTLHRRSAARLLEQAREFGDALALYCQAGAFEDATRIILREAPSLAAQSRYQTLEEWLAMLPAQTVEERPWLLYWLAVARKPSVPSQAAALFERAYAGLDDRVGKLMSAAGAADCFTLEWRNQRALEPWINAVVDLAQPYPDFASNEEELRVLPSMLAAFVYSGATEHPMYSRLRQRADDLLAADPGADHSPLLGAISYYRLWLEGLAALESYGRHARAPTARGRVAPLTRVWGHCATSYLASLRGNAADAFAEVEQAESVAKQYGLRFILSTIYLRGASAALGAADIDRASAYCERAVPVLEFSHDRELCLYTHVRGWIEVLRGEVAAAERTLRRALEMADRSGQPSLTINTRSVLAMALAEAGDLAGAERMLSEARARRFSRASWHYRAMCDMVEAVLAHRAQDDERCLRSVSAWLETLRNYGSVGEPLVHHPKHVAQLLARALEHGIEPAFARTMIARLGLTAPDPSLASWPWRITIRALGNFALERDGRAIEARGKSQRRPRDLLMALVALGGRDVNVIKLMQAAWPQRTATQNTFDVAIHRLRRLLGEDRALLVADGKVSLNPEMCWVDVWAWDALARRAEAASDKAAARDAGRLLELYRGRLLAGEPERTWLLPARARLQSRFLRVVSRLGSRLEQSHGLPEAIAMYQRAVEIEPLAEDIYRRLMNAHSALGQRTEAIEAYRRCRQMLSVVLGVKPSAETEALRAGLTST